MQKIQDSFADPVCMKLWLSVGGISLVRMGVCREWHGHTAGIKKNEHDHVPVLAAVSFRFNAVKKGIASAALARKPLVVLFPYVSTNPRKGLGGALALGAGRHGPCIH